MALLEYLKVHSDGKRPNPESEPHCINMSWPQPLAELDSELQGEQQGEQL